MTTSKSFQARALGGRDLSERPQDASLRFSCVTGPSDRIVAHTPARSCHERILPVLAQGALAGVRWPAYGRGVPWKPHAERGQRVRSDAIAPREGSHYVPDGTVHAVDDQTGELACGFDGELIEIEAAWDSPAFASVKCADCEQELAR